MSNVNPVSKTAFWTVGVRINDAENESSLCDDYLANRFKCREVDDVLEHFSELKMSAQCIVARHAIFDNYVQLQLQENKQIQFIVLGAGFDTRPYRIEGGLRKPRLGFKIMRLSVYANAIGIAVESQGL